jgi:hypothetical protein
MGHQLNSVYSKDHKIDHEYRPPLYRGRYLEIEINTNNHRLIENQSPPQSH